TIRVRNASTGDYRSYLRFNLGGVSGVTSAKLRLFCTDESPVGGKVYAVNDTGWTETGLTWANQPSKNQAHPLRGLARAPAGAWVEIDGTHPGPGGAPVFGFAEGSSNSAYYSSREGSNPPQLVVNSGGGGGGGAPVADFSGSPLTGQAPLQTAFTDR